MKNIINSVLMLLFFIGCKGQKEGLELKKDPSKLPLKIEFVTKKDSTLVKLYIPQEFSLKSTYNKQITIDNFQYRNRDLIDKPNPHFLEGYNQNSNQLISPPYKIKLNKNEEKKFILYIGYYLYLSDEELKMLNYEKPEEKINDIGNISNYSKTLNTLIPKPGYIYVTIYNKETLLIPDIEIPIEFK